MRNWKGCFEFLGFSGKIYDWTPTSEAFYSIIKKFAEKEYRMIEFGSSTGHISYRLAKEGFAVTLLDIRPEPIEIAKRNFAKRHVKAEFVCADVFGFSRQYDMAWNSGLIQCFDDAGKKKVIKKLAEITPRLLLFYPDVEDPAKKAEAKVTPTHKIPGVGDAREYDIKHIPEIMYAHFDDLHFGRVTKEQTGLGFAMYWVCGLRR